MSVLCGLETIRTIITSARVLNLHKQAEWLCPMKHAHVHSEQLLGSIAFVAYFFQNFL